jgi:hypothetical protein
MPADLLRALFGNVTVPTRRLFILFSEELLFRHGQASCASRTAKLARPALAKYDIQLCR